MIDVFNLDEKMDDGLPLAGKATAHYPVTNAVASSPLTPVSTASASVASAASATTCFDNQNNISNPVIYSFSVDGGANQNCAVAIKW